MTNACHTITTQAVPPFPVPEEIVNRSEPQQLEKAMATEHLFTNTGGLRGQAFV